MAGSTHGDSRFHWKARTFNSSLKLLRFLVSIARIKGLSFHRMSGPQGQCTTI